MAKKKSMSMRERMSLVNRSAMMVAEMAAYEASPMPTMPRHPRKNQKRWNGNNSMVQSFSYYTYPFVSVTN